MLRSMRLSADGLFDLKRFEKCELEAYPDEGGKWTIGGGSTLGVKKGDRIDQAEADRRLAVKIAEVEAVVNAAVKLPELTQGQFDALICFTYNVGNGAFRGSTLLELLNSNDTTAAAEQFSRWIHVKGVISPNLVRRRFCEVVRFLT